MGHNFNGRSAQQQRCLTKRPQKHEVALVKNDRHQPTYGSRQSVVLKAFLICDEANQVTVYALFQLQACRITV